ncbi:hypothetical protein [Sorangium sp. So ce854]|uniref:hypothetical protein n=1 Tax=Sorangium sp. So ce854 TaxID=3133322 RepID=UPI003F613BEB
MRSFIATMVYELHPDTPPDARKLLRAHLVGRRWQDRHDGAPMPSTAVWIRRSAQDHETTDDLHAACARELGEAAAAVARAGRPIQVTRAWIQVSGAGTYGLAALARPPGG